MSQDPLDALLRRYAESAAPVLTSSVAADVRREIQARQQRRFTWNTRWDWAELVRVRHLVVAGCAAAVIASMVPIVVFRANDVGGRARASLHLEMFSTRPPQTASALLGAHTHP